MHERLVDLGVEVVPFGAVTLDAEGRPQGLLHLVEDRSDGSRQVAVLTRQLGVVEHGEEGGDHGDDSLFPARAPSALERRTKFPYSCSTL